MKRRRTGSFVAARPIARVQRPIDKQIIQVAKTLAVATQAATVLTTATFPCTVTGLRWEGIYNAPTTGLGRIIWAIILVKDGNSANTIASSDGATIYEPEQNVLAWGEAGGADIDAGTGPALMKIEGKTKTMRKLMGGDQLQCIVIAPDGGGNFEMGIQFFCKT